MAEQVHEFAAAINKRHFVQRDHVAEPLGDSVEMHRGVVPSTMEAG